MLRLSNPVVMRLMLVLFATGLSLTIQAQKTFLPNAYEDFSVTIEGNQGTNGAGLAYDPVRGLYYASIAGNERYPLIVFNQQGELIKQQYVEFDIRGIWYNQKTERLEGNGYSKYGWVAYAMNGDGTPKEAEPVVYVPGMNQPSGQSVGTYWRKKKLVVFLHNNFLHLHRAKDGQEKKIIELEGIPSSLDEINQTTAVATNVKGYEFGLLNYEKQRVYFFNKKGQYVDQCNLPDGAITSASFRWGFANQRVFLYDVVSRTWTAYQVFK